MMNEEVLMHHGIKGQRWGVRRYQNEDGTRTAAGKRHEKTLDSYDSNKSNARQDYRQAKKDYNKSFNDYYYKSMQVFSPIKKQREANMDRLNKALSDAEKLKNAEKQYKAERKEARAEGKAKAEQIRKNMTTGEKTLAVMLAGPYGARAVSNYMAAGSSKGSAYAKAFLGGNYGIPVSAIVRDRAAENEKFN